MGGRSSSGNRNTTPAEFKYDEPVLEPLKPTRYAREIFDENYREARQMAKRWGNEPFGLQNLYWNDEQLAMSKQALRGVQALINSEARNIDLDVEFGVLTPEEAEQRRVALNAVQRTLNRQWENR